jgi:hypothetical protein
MPGWAEGEGQMSAIESTVNVATTALTAYAHVGQDAIRVTLVTLNGSPWFRRADSGAILPVMPTEFRTVTDVAAMLATVDKRFNLGSLRWSSIPAHSYKEALSFETLAARRGVSDDLVAQTLANYETLNALKAA